MVIKSIVVVLVKESMILVPDSLLLRLYLSLWNRAYTVTN